MGLKVSVTSVMRLLKEEGYSLDHRRQGWKSRRVDLVGGGAVSIKEFFNPGTKKHYFEPVYYTGNPAQYWESKEFEDIRQAVSFINIHIDKALQKYEEDLNKGYESDRLASKRVARQYIKKACVTNDAASIPTVGEMIVKVDLIPDGTVVLHTDRGKQVTIHTFDSRYPTKDPWDTSREHLTWVSPDNIKTAALVGTDSATIWAIAPESLGRVMEDPEFKVFLSNWYQGRDPEEMEDLWRRNGGAVFHTGADGIFDVKIPTPEGTSPIVNEEGYLPPYGTPEYRK